MGIGGARLSRAWLARSALTRALTFFACINGRVAARSTIGNRLRTKAETALWLAPTRERTRRPCALALFSCFDCAIATDTRVSL